MSTVVTMPQKGLTEESALLANWYVKSGDRVRIGDPLFAIEIGKATFDVEAEAEGELLEIFIEAGNEVAIKAPVCVIGEPGETYERPAASVSPTPEGLPADSPAARPSAKPAAPTRPAGEEVFISPRARQIARRMNLDYTQAVPSGAEGRIIQQDIDALAAQPRSSPAPAVDPEKTAEDYTLVPNSGIRRLIAKNMHSSLAEMAQLSMTAYFDASELLAFRSRIKKHKGEADYVDITLNDMILYAVSRTVLEHPTLNAHFSDKEMKLFHHVHLGVAVNTERGLMVPTLKDADLLGLSELSLQAAALAAACRDNRIAPDKLTGGTITVSNLGNTGISSFTPIINPPQTALVGVCGLEWKVRPDREGKPELYQAMGLSLTVDHRAVDGAPAAEFLHALCKKLEAFSLLLTQS